MHTGIFGGLERQILELSSPNADNSVDRYLPVCPLVRCTLRPMPCTDCLSNEYCEVLEEVFVSSVITRGL